MGAMSRVKVTSAGRGVSSKGMAQPSARVSGSVTGLGEDLLQGRPEVLPMSRRACFPEVHIAVIHPPAVQQATLRRNDGDLEGHLHSQRARQRLFRVED